MVQKAALSSRHAELSLELSCVSFVYRYQFQPSVAAAFNRFFIAAAARMDIIQNIKDTDVEQRRLATDREGAASQRRTFATLRSDMAAQTTLDRASAALRDQREAARLDALRVLSGIADANRLTSLVDSSQTLAAYGARRMRANGMMGVAEDVAALGRIHAGLIQAYHVSTRCHTGELPARLHVWWDLVPTAQPATFNTSLQSGVPKTFVLTMSDADCAGEGSTSPRSRGAPPP